jgi:hypothetical protein
MLKRCLSVATVFGLSVLAMASAASITIDPSPPSGSVVEFSGNEFTISGHIINVGTTVEYFSGYGSAASCSPFFCFDIEQEDPAFRSAFPGTASLPPGGSYTGPLFDVYEISTPIQSLLLIDIQLDVYSATNPSILEPVEVISNLTINPASATVPEPSTTALLGFATCLIVIGRRNCLGAIAR